MKSINLLDYPNVFIGNNVLIKGNNVTIEEGAIIQDNVTIEAEKIHIGFDAKIEKDTVIKGLGVKMNRFILGDNTLLGFRNQILVPEFVMLDYSQLHNTCLNSGYKPINIGYNCWIGQGSILNSTEELTIENNVRIGTGSQLWTHVASGELFEGCTLYGQKKLHIKDNVWIVGGAVISPGLTLEKNSIIMTGSILTKSTEAFNTYVGIPAIKVTEKLSFWKKLSQEEKISLLHDFISDFYDQYPIHRNKIHVLDCLDGEINDCDKENLFIVTDIKLSDFVNTKNSIFDLKTKCYIKTRSKIEIDWIKFTVGFRVRFIPWENKNQV